MTGMMSVQKVFRSKNGQALVELTLVVPLMLLLVYGVLEIGSAISTYLTLTHTSREGANLTSRGTIPDDALTAIIAAADPTIGNGNLGQWRIIYSKIVQAPGVPCPPQTPCDYIVEEQIVRGNLGETSKIGPVGATVNQNLSGFNNVLPGQIFHAIEVFYDYGPDVITFIGNTFSNKIFYERSLFTQVSGTA
jgi:hypothetical protein